MKLRRSAIKVFKADPFFAKVPGSAVRSISINAGYTGAITQTAAQFSIGSADASVLSGGSFTCGAGAHVSFNNTSFTLSGGQFNCQNGALDALSPTLTLTGGTFNAPSNTFTFGEVSGADSLFSRGAGATFNHNNGTVSFGGNRVLVVINDGDSGTLEFFDLSVNVADVLAPFPGDTLLVRNNLDLASGIVTAGTLEAQGDVTVGAAFGSEFANANFHFTGANDQTYTNNGGFNPSGFWVLNKTSGTVNLASDLDLSNHIGSPFFMVNGTITTGDFAVIAGGRELMSSGTGYIAGNLERSFAESGINGYPIGTANGFSPVTVGVGTLNINPSSLRIGVFQTAHPNAPNPGGALRRFWRITETGDLTATLQFRYLETDLPPVNELSLELKRYTGSGNDFETIPFFFNPTQNTATTQNPITEFSDWTMLSPLAPTSANVEIGGRVTSEQGGAVAGAQLLLTDQTGVTRAARTNNLGVYRFTNVPAGAIYTVSISHRRYNFPTPTRVVSVSDSIGDLDFTAYEHE